MYSSPDATKHTEMSSKNVQKQSSPAGYARDTSPETVTEGRATSSLLIEGESSTSHDRTPQIVSAEVDEIGISDLEYISFESCPRIVDDFEARMADYQGLRYDPTTVPMAEVTAIPSMTPDMQSPCEETIAQGSSSDVDADFGAAGDAFTGRWAETTSDHSHFLPAFEEGWYRDTLDHEDEDRESASLPSQRSGGRGLGRRGDIPEVESRTGASDAAAAPEADDVDEALLPVAVQLARRVYAGIKPRLDRVIEEGLPSWPHNPSLDVAEAVNPPPPAEGIPEASQVNTRRTTRSSRVRTEQPLTEPQASHLATDSLEVESQAPGTQKTRSRGGNKAGRKAASIQPQSSSTAHVPPPSPSIAPGVAPKASGAVKRGGRGPRADHAPHVMTVEQPASSQVSVTLGTPQLPGAKGATKTARKTKASQAHSNGIVGSGVAGPSTSASTGQSLYPPALAQRIWDLAEAGKYHAALGLFDPQEKWRRITGEAEVQEYLREHPEAGENLRPLTTGGPRKELFLCGSKTFWVPTEAKKEGSRDFVLERRTTGCPVGYATQDNLYKHVYKFHLKKVYGQYPRKGSSGKEQKKPAKGKASRTQEKPRAPKEDEDDYVEEDEED